MALVEGQKKKKTSSNSEAAVEPETQPDLNDSAMSTGSDDQKQPQASTSSGVSVPQTPSFLTTTSIGGITIQFPMPADAGEVFSSLPEWIVEDVADFTLFSLQ